MRAQAVLASNLAVLAFVAGLTGVVVVGRAPLAEGLRALARVKARPVATDGRAPEGPVVVRGKVAAAPVVRSPSGATGGAWMAWVGSWVGQGKSRHFEIACEVGDASGLVVEVGGESLRYAPGGARLRPAMGNTFPIHDAAEVFLDLDAVTSAAVADETRVPEAVRAACARVPSDRPLYREAVIRAGADVDVVACRRGDRLEPCGDGFDYVTSGSIVQRVEAAREDRAGGLLLLTGLAGLLLGLAGYGGVRSMVPDRAAPKEDAP